MGRPKEISQSYINLLEDLRADDGSELQKTIVGRSFEVRDLKAPKKSLLKMIEEARLNAERRSLFREIITERAPHGYRVFGQSKYAEPYTPDLIKFDSISEPQVVFYEELMKQGWIWIMDEAGNMRLTEPKTN